MQSGQTPGIKHSYWEPGWTRHAMPYFGLLSWHQWQRGLNCPMTLGSTWNLNIFMDLETGRKPNWQTETNNLVRNLPIVVTSWLNRRKWMQMMQWEHLGGTSLIIAWWWVFKNCSSVNRCKFMFQCWFSLLYLCESRSSWSHWSVQDLLIQTEQEKVSIQPKSSPRLWVSWHCSGHCFCLT